VSEIRPFEALRDAGPAEVWDTLGRWRAARRRFALASVVETRGFTPRKPGAHMLIAADGETAGTIGGGAIEREVIEQARALLRAGGSTLVRRHLTQELGMCCGGEMAVFLETLEPAPCLLLFGAGYIARPLAALAAGCGFEVTVVDERSEWADPERFPHAAVECRAPEEWLRARATTPDDYAVVVTHDHGLDQRLAQELLRRPLAFVGMVGSVPKQRKFALRLRARGFSDEQIAHLRVPLGLAIGADTPEEIAVSVVAELIAARRGEAAPVRWVPPARGEPASEAPRSGESPARATVTNGGSAGSPSDGRSDRTHGTARPPDGDPLRHGPVTPERQP
jgi:xanthine dehydrogenase accessory factor